MNTPLISISMSVRNGADTIRETIESVIAQSYQNWELIISDNCSSDETVSIINSFPDPGIRLIKNEFNKGENTASIDDDSYLEPLNLEKN